MTSSLVSNSRVQASDARETTFPPNINGEGIMLHRDMMVICSFSLKVVCPEACHSLRGPRYPSGRPPSCQTSR